MSNLSFAKNALGQVSTFTNTPAPANTNNAAVAFTQTGPTVAPTAFVPTGQFMGWGDIRAELTRIGADMDRERLNQRLSKRDIARRTNMSPKTVGYVMKGWTQNINKYIEVANALKMRISLTK